MFKAYPYSRWKRHSWWTKCNIAPMEKTLWHQWNISSQFIAKIEKPWSYKIFFFWSGNYTSTIAKIFCFCFLRHNKFNLQTLTYIFYKSTAPAKIRSVAFGAVLLKLLKSAFRGIRICLFCTLQKTLPTLPLTSPHLTPGKLQS